MDFTHVHTGTIIMHWSATWHCDWTKARVKHEAQRLTRMREDPRCKRGETEDDAEREQRLTRMRDYARSRRESEDGVCTAHGPTDGGPWLSGSK